MLFLSTKKQGKSIDESYSASSSNVSSRKLTGLNPSLQKNITGISSDLLSCTAHMIMAFRNGRLNHMKLFLNLKVSLKISISDRERVLRILKIILWLLPYIILFSTREVVLYSYLTNNNMKFRNFMWFSRISRMDTCLSCTF